MSARIVNVIGGGPAGLLSAQLLARDHPDWTVTVHERLPPDETFGFGVGLTHALMHAINQEVPALHDDLVANSAEFSAAAFWLPAGRVELPSFHAGAIGRTRLLQLLIEHAQNAGVEVRIGSTPTVDDLAGGSDLVIGADGVSSTTRERLTAELGASEQIGRGLFIWCGAEIKLEGTIFIPVQTQDGTFVAHAYPYDTGLATFVIETGADALERAGCRSDEFDGEGDSDEPTLDYLSKAFEQLLEGSRFLGNRSRWMNFRTVRCERWSHGNVVLLGDAAATAHPTIGSGTKLALEAAISLAASMKTVTDEPPASRLPDYEARERPQIERLQDRAHRSQLWWESFPSRLSLSPARIAFAYMSRAGAVSLQQLRQSAPGLADQAIADYAGLSARQVPAEEFADWILRRPLQVNGSALSGRLLPQGGRDPDVKLWVDCPDPWSPSVQATLQQVAADAARQRIIGLYGGNSRGELLDRLALGERLRSELGAVVAVSCGEDQLGDAIDGLVAGRADLVEVSDRERAHECS
jgi:anthraniloyl-CoA monooxygenase